MPIATLLFFLIPLVEMVILIKVGGLIGVLPTVLLVVMTAVCGVWLLRAQGLATLARVQDKLSRGEMPDTELLEGIMLIFGGALLLTPGFATDAIGFVCLLPGLRRPLASRIIRTATFRQFGSAQGFSYQHMHGHNMRRDNYQAGETIDGEFSDQSDASNRPAARDQQQTLDHQPDQHKESP